MQQNIQTTLLMTEENYTLQKIKPLAGGFRTIVACPSVRDALAVGFLHQ